MDKHTEDLINSASFIPFGFLMGGPIGAILTAVAGYSIAKLNQINAQHIKNESIKRKEEMFRNQEEIINIKKEKLANNSCIIEETCRLFSDTAIQAKETFIQPGLIGINGYEFLHKIGTPKLFSDNYPVIIGEKYNKGLIQAYVKKNESFLKIFYDIKNDVRYSNNLKIYKYSFKTPFNSGFYPEIRYGFSIMETEHILWCETE